MTTGAKDPAAVRALAAQQLDMAMRHAVTVGALSSEEAARWRTLQADINRTRLRQGEAPLGDSAALAADAGASLAVRGEGFTAADLMSKTLPEPKYVVPGLLVEGLSLFAGKPKGGKSWMTLDWALAVAAGGRALGQIKVDPGDVLLLALEDSPRRLQARCRQLLRGGTAPDRLRIHTAWPHLDQGGLAAIGDWVRAHPDARLVVVDTLAAVRPAQPVRNTNAYSDDYAALADLQRLASDQHVAVVVVHHLRKLPSTDPLDMVSGTTGLTASADAVLVLVRERSRADAVLHVISRDLGDSELALKQDTTAGGWELLGDAARWRLSEDRAAVLEVVTVAGEAVGIKAIAEIIGKPYGPTKALVWRMAEDGLLARAPGGRYCVPRTCVPSLPLEGYAGTQVLEVRKFGSTTDEGER